MKKSPVIVLMFCLLFSVFMFVGCSGKDASSAPVLSSKVLTAKEITTKFKESKLPVTNVIVYNEQNDENKLLGRPGQYVSKVNFADSRIEQIDETNPKGGSIETFSNTKDLNNRKTYIETFVNSNPAFAEYLVVNDKYLLRLGRDLTPTQVEEYKQVFTGLK